MSTKTVASDSKQAQLMYDEWTILNQGLEEFPGVLRSTHRIMGKQEVKCFGFGSPRNFHMVVETKRKGWLYRKTFRIDVRSGSCHFWVGKYDAAAWTVSKL